MEMELKGYELEAILKALNVYFDQQFEQAHDAVIVYELIAKFQKAIKNAEEF